MYLTKGTCVYIHTVGAVGGYDAIPAEMLYARGITTSDSNSGNYTFVRFYTPSHIAGIEWGYTADRLTPIEDAETEALLDLIS